MLAQESGRAAEAYQEENYGKSLDPSRDSTPELPVLAARVALRLPVLAARVELRLPLFAARGCDGTESVRPSLIYSIVLSIQRWINTGGTTPPKLDSPSALYVNLDFKPCNTFTHLVYCSALQR